MERPFGMDVYELLRARYGPAGLGNYEDIQKLKSADRMTAITLLFGADAASAERLRESQPEVVVNDFSARVTQAQKVLKDHACTEAKLTLCSGLLQTIGEGLSAL